MVEQGTHKPLVVGSTPTLGTCTHLVGTKVKACLRQAFLLFFDLWRLAPLFIRQRVAHRQAAGPPGGQGAGERRYQQNAR